MIVHKDIEQSSDEWFALRAGLPTASEASKLVSSTGKLSTSMKGYALLMAAEKYAGKPLDRWKGNKSTERGTLLEPEARRLYEFMTDSVVEQVGFITDDKKQAGASPDGLVGKKGMVEIKCLEATAHTKTLDYFAANGKAPTTYITQCQMQMIVADKEWNDLFYYHPDLPSIIIQQKPIKVIVDALSAQIRAVLIERDRLIKVLEAAA